MKKVIAILLFLFTFQFASAEFSSDMESYAKVFEKITSSKKYSSKTGLLKLRRTIAPLSEKEKFYSKKPLFDFLVEAIDNKIAILDIKKDIANSVKADFAKELVDYGVKFRPVTDKYEYLEGGDLYRYSFSKFYKLNSNNYFYFLDKSKKNNYLLLKTKSGKYLLLENYSIEKLIPFYELKYKAKHYVSSSNSYYEKGEDVYSSSITYYFLLKDKRGIYPSDRLNGKTYDDFILVKSKGKYGIASENNEQFLFKKSLLSGVKNKDNVMGLLAQRINYFDVDKLDDNFLKIKQVALNLTKDKKTEEEKIKAIYSYIVHHLEYDMEGINSGKKRIYSGIAVFKDKLSVCDGYARLFIYMLAFNGIDSELAFGYALDSENLGNIMHAWVRIGNMYYDPTYDDPVKQDYERNEKDFRYFAVPKNLYYIARTKGDAIPDFFKNMSEIERKVYISKKYLEYHIKNPKVEHNLLKYYMPLIKLGVEKVDDLKISSILKKAEQYNLGDGYSFIDDRGVSRKIKHVNFFRLKDDVNYNYDLLLQLGEDAEDMLVFFMKGEYRIVTNVDYR